MSSTPPKVASYPVWSRPHRYRNGFAALLVWSGSLIAAPLQQLDVSRILDDARVLAADSLEGRGTATRGGELAAQFLAHRLSAYGLEPAGSEGTWYQSFPVHASKPLPGSRLEFRAGEASFAVELWRDYLLLSQGHEKFIARSSPLVFAGYGIVAPEYDYSDYGSIDVRGSVVVMLSGEPVSDDPAFFDGDRQTRHSSVTTKHWAAQARGARGTIIIPTPRSPEMPTWEDWQREFAFEDVRFPFGTPEQLHVVLRPEAAALLLDAAGMSLDAMFESDARGLVRTNRMDASMSFVGESFERDGRARNVAGLIRGRDPVLRDEFVMVGAHYDHLGIGPAVDDDSVYNGMLDNALGTAAVLELARILSEHRTGLSRSVLFVFFTGEEKGLLGSRFFVEQPLVPLHRITAMLNVDGISYIDRVRSIIPVGSELSTMQEAVRGVSIAQGLEVDEVPTPFLRRDPLFTSDHWSFITAGVPSVLISEGLTFEREGENGVRRYLHYGNTLYHTPRDDSSIPVSAEAVLQHVSFIAKLTTDLATTYAPPQWLPGSPYNVARLRSVAEGR